MTEQLFKAEFDHIQSELDRLQEEWSFWVSLDCAWNEFKLVQAELDLISEQRSELYAQKRELHKKVFEAQLQDIGERFEQGLEQILDETATDDDYPDDYFSLDFSSLDNHIDYCYQLQQKPSPTFSSFLSYLRWLFSMLYPQHS